MKRLQIQQNFVYEKNFTYTKKFYVHETTAVNLSKIYFLQNAKKTCKTNDRDLNRDWKIRIKWSENRKKKKRHRRHDIEAWSNETLLAMRKLYCDNLPYQP